MKLRIGPILLLSAVLGGGAAAEDVVLRPHFDQGDSYSLSLSAQSNAALSARGENPSNFDEDGVLHYEATVVVLETDGHGVPVRERHQGVRLTSEKPGQPGSLFLSGTFEVARQPDGSVRVFVSGKRADSNVETVIARLLSNQFEYSIGALVDPGRPVALGETWNIPVPQLRAYLKGRGVRNVKLDGPATATLARNDAGALAVHYQIPIASFLLRKMPANAAPARSAGSLVGEVELGPQRSPVHHVAKLELSLSGAMVKSGVAASYPWRYQSSEAFDEHTRRVEPELASAY